MLFVNTRHGVGSESGWYRILSQHDQIGVVASANALEALCRLDSVPSTVGTAVGTLLSRQRQDGSWPFISTVHDTGVVDATAASLLALGEISRTDRFPVGVSAHELEEAIHRAAEWLQQAQDDGGWGIVAGGPFRAYSSAIALQALCRAGWSDTEVVTLGLARLTAERDPATGGWRDFSGRVSVAITAEAVRAFLAASPEASRRGEVRRALDWILSRAETTDYWMRGADCPQHEEIPVVRGSDIRRIHCYYSPRPMALTALADSGLAGDSPIYWRAVARLVHELEDDDWSAYGQGVYTEPPSWMVYDLSLALASARSQVPEGTQYVWAGRSRLLFQNLQHGAARRLLQETWPVLAACIGALLLLMAIYLGDIKLPLPLSLLLVLVVGLSINLASSYAYDRIKAKGMG